MEYAIIFEDEIDGQIGSILKKEIERFDIRSSVNLIGYRAKLNDGNIDLIVYIGSRLPKNRISASVPQYFLYQSYKSSNSGKRSPKSNDFLKVIPDFFYDGIEAINGSPLFDLFRITNSKTTDLATPYILVITATKSKKEERSQLERTLKDSFKNHAVVTCNVKNIFENIAIAKEASAAIVSCPLGEMIALHFNVPYVRLVKKSFFSKSERSLLNRVANRILVKEITVKNAQEVKDEVFQLLSDHQYSASLMNDFQKTKETISKPFIRSVAQEIVESLED